jgi:hypothetical protein
VERLRIVDDPQRAALLGLPVDELTSVLLQYIKPPASSDVQVADHALTALFFIQVRAHAPAPRGLRTTSNCLRRTVGRAFSRAFSQLLLSATALQMLQAWVYGPIPLPATRLQELRKSCS